MTDRRRFIQAAALSGAGMAIASAGCSPSRPENGSSVNAPAVEPFELDEVTVAELHRKMDSGELTARSITELYLKRIEALDRRGPELRSIIEINHVGFILHQS